MLVLASAFVDHAVNILAKTESSIIASTLPALSWMCCAWELMKLSAAMLTTFLLPSWDTAA